MTRSKAQRSQPNSRSQAGPVSTSKTATKRGRSKIKPSNAPQLSGLVKLPRSFRSAGDETSLRLRASNAVANSLAGAATIILALAPTSITTTGYRGLGDSFPILLGMAKQYSRFMITRVTAQLIPTTAATAGGFVAIGYEADDTNTSSPPTSLTDVTSAVHSDVAQVTEIAGIEFNVSDYFNEWKYTTGSGGSSTSIGQAGAIQIYAINSGVQHDQIAILQIEVDIHFSGYRSTV